MPNQIPIPMMAKIKKGACQLVMEAMYRLNGTPKTEAALKAAKAKGITVVGLTGKDGGKMAGLVDIEIRAPHSEYADRAQEIHIKVIHSLIDSIEVGLDYTN